MFLFTRLRAAVLILLAVGLSGCGSVTYERARVAGSTVSNPTLGRGVSYRLPSNYALLNPYAPVPALPESQAFENYLRAIVATNDKPDTSYAFRETLLYRAQDSYIVAFHTSQNRSSTFRSMPPERRALVLPQIAVFLPSQTASKKTSLSNSPATTPSTTTAFCSTRRAQPVAAGRAPDSSCSATSPMW